ncbi:2-deoxy-D-gluconate 3-dehydrogenase [Acidocella aquatica]|uniref:2-deoxy-D-gluconate 3-dehydrogenase n=1 Tax=Acidocella aquatica TaxID=1922313 RepID=A0ABQ6A3Y7_9PROT|nr:glucose 1-dehydrogenase [Acidocella aquatica]GLR66012.1 2-deoxy-D-gluconate 3-dehydrogenase [Acidocella aquatica]
MLNDLFGLEGKSCLVTGASRGIGRAVAIGLAEAGADVALVARTESELKDVAARIQSLGRRALVLPADMSKFDTLPILIENMMKAWGKIDVLVNNAGISIRAPIVSASMDDFDYMVDVNLKSILILSQAAIPYMKQSGSGKIINVTSLCAVIADPGSGIYGMTKGGLTQLSRSLAVELARDGINIQVNCIGPGAHVTTQWREIVKNEPKLEALLVAKIPMGRVAEPEEIIGAFVFLASRASNYMTGQTMYMDGGWLVS